MADVGKRRITGRSLVTAAMIGLAEAVEGKKPEQIPIVETAEPGRADPIDLLLDPLDPRLTVAFVRPWVLPTLRS